MKMNDFTGYLKKRRFSRSTITSYRKVIRLYLEWVSREQLEPEQITYKDLLAFMKYCTGTGNTQRTIQHYMNAVKHYYNHLEETGRIAVNPVTNIEVKGVRRKTLYHILDPHQMHRLYNQYPEKNLRDKRNKVILGLLVYQGLRSDELGGLEIENIKFREGKVDVPGGINHNGRVLPLESHQVMDLYDYILEIRPKILKQSKQVTAKLLVSPRGGTQAGNFIWSMLKQLKRINPAVKSVRQIRTSVIVKWLKTHNLREVQYLAGHRYISSTEMYLQNEVEGLKEEIQQYHPLG